MLPVSDSGSLPGTVTYRPLLAEGLEQGDWYGHVLSTGDDPSLLARRYRPHGHRDELSRSKPRTVLNKEELLGGKGADKAVCAAGMPGP